MYVGLARALDVACLFSYFIIFCIFIAGGMSGGEVLRVRKPIDLLVNIGIILVICDYVVFKELIECFMISNGVRGERGMK